MKGKIAVLEGPRKIVVREYDLKDIPPGSVLIKVKRANVCGSEIHMWHGAHPVIKNAGLGHEFMGEILELSEGVETDSAGKPVKIGDRVAPVYYLTCFKCRECLRGNFSLCENAYQSWATHPDVAPHFRSGFATHYVINPSQFFFKIPDTVSDHAAAGANCALSQVIYALDKAGLKSGELIVVQGAGGLGLNAIAVAKEQGAYVCVIEGVTERLELAKQFGADYVIDMKEFTSIESRANHFKQITGTNGADVVLEVTGVAAAFAEALELVRASGRVVSVGNVNISSEFQISLAPGMITRKNLSVFGTVRYDPIFLNKALKFLERNHNKYPYQQLTDKEYCLDDVSEALEKSEARSIARPVIVP